MMQYRNSRLVYSCENTELFYWQEINLLCDALLKEISPRLDFWLLLLSLLGTLLLLPNKTPAFSPSRLWEGSLLRSGY